MQKMEGVTTTRVSSVTPFMKVLVIIFVILAAVIAFVAAQALGPQTTPVTYVFTDINNDGNVDLIVTGKVIYNAEPQNLPVSQTSSKKP